MLHLFLLITFSVFWPWFIHLEGSREEKMTYKVNYGWSIELAGCKKSIALIRRRVRIKLCLVSHISWWWHTGHSRYSSKSQQVYTFRKCFFFCQRYFKFSCRKCIYVLTLLNGILHHITWARLSCVFKALELSIWIVLKDQHQMKYLENVYLCSS